MSKYSIGVSASNVMIFGPPSFVSRVVTLYGNDPATGPMYWSMPSVTLSSLSSALMTFLQSSSPSTLTTLQGLIGSSTSLMLNAALSNAAVSFVAWVYLPSSASGPLIGLSNAQYPTAPSMVGAGMPGAFPPLSIVSGALRVGDEIIGQQTTTIGPGWHVIASSIYLSGTSFIQESWLDGISIGRSSTTTVPAMFGGLGNLPYATVALGYLGSWGFFNGAIAYLALYNRRLQPSDIASIIGGTRVTSGLVGEYVGDNYNPSTGVWYDSSGNNYNLQPMW